jgi:hypothetical protein
MKRGGKAKATVINTERFLFILILQFDKIACCADTHEARW